MERQILPRAVLSALLLGTVPATAQTIGYAVGVTPAATGSEGGRLKVGAGVVRDEVVRTGPSGVIELRFLDDTNLALGPSSSVTLDEFVYAGGTASRVAVGLGKGAFRFATGVSPKKAYKISTPLSAIGVRGTDLSGEIIGGQERFTLWHGSIRVCTTAGDCVTLSRAGQTVTITPAGAVLGGPPVVVPLFCAQASGAELCVPYGGNDPFLRPDRGGDKNSPPTQPSTPPSPPTPTPTPSPSPSPTGHL